MPDEDDGDPVGLPLWMVLAMVFLFCAVAVILGFVFIIAQLFTHR